MADDTRTNSAVRFWDNPPPDAIGEDPIEFIHLLGQPTWIRVTGRDASRSRAIVTLLHGNEPSGLRALHRYLKSGETPATDMVFFVAAVDAALAPPLFSHRFLPGERDLNRCFGRDGDSSQERLTARLMALLADLEPEAVIDIHNTSSHSVPFVVAYNESARASQVARLLGDKLILISRPLGTLIEQDLGEVPILTLEVGGIFDGGADETAWRSLQQIVSTEDLFTAPEGPLLRLANPLRLELVPGHSVTYASSASAESDVTLPTTIDQLNFAFVQEDTPLGWLGPKGIAALSAPDRTQTERVHELFQVREGVLSSRGRMTLFMITTDSNIATQDCILYFVPES